MKNKTVIFLLIFIFICMAMLSFMITCGIFKIIDYKKEKEIEKQELLKKEIQRQENERIEALKIELQKIELEKAERERHIKIPFKEPSNLNYKSKEEIYDIRKNAVDNSIFKNPNYYPSNEVFGQIESNKPWNSMRQCLYKETKTSDIIGPSEEDRYISNPELLVAIEYGFYGHYCEDRTSYELKYSKPESIIYNKEENEIEIIYGGLPYCTIGENTWYSFKGLNANDLGYKYAYIDKEKSTFNLNFVESQNISNSIVEFQDFIHLGSSCGHTSGCNNASPDQPALNFFYPCTGEHKEILKDQTIYIKLWKTKPNSPQDKSDITEKIVIKKVWVNK